jgi:hypothetical protein
VEIVQGVLIRVRTEGATSVDGLTTATNKLTTATENLAKATERATPKMTATKEEAGKLQKTMEALSGQALPGVSGQLARIASFVIPGAVFAAFGTLTKNAIDSADAMNDMSKRTGFATETLSALGYGAKQADTNLEAVVVGVRNMSRAVEVAAGGNGELQKTFARLGVSLEDLRHSSPEELFQKLVNGIQGVKDPTERLALAQQVLGRSAQELMPFISDLAGDGFGKLREEAEKAGVVIGQDTAQAADQMNDSLEKVKANVTATGNVLAVALLPALNGTLDAMNSPSWTRFLNPLVAIRETIRGVAGAAAFAGTAIGAFFGALQNPGRNKDGSPLGFMDSLKDIWAQTKAGIVGSPDLEKQLQSMFPDAVGAPTSTVGRGTTNRTVKAAPDTEAAKKAAEERRDLERQEQTLREIRMRHEEIARAADAEGELERKINELISARDRELDKVRHLALDPARLMTAEREINEVYSKAIDDAQADSVKKFTDDLHKDTSDAVAKMREETAHQFAKNLDDMEQRGHELLAAMEEKANGAVRAFTAGVHGSLSAELADIAQTGGRNLGEIAGQAFGAMVAKASGSAVDALFKGAAALFGQNITETADGKFLVAGDSKRYDTLTDAAASSKGGRLLGAGIAAAQIGITGYDAGKLPGGRTSATLGGAMAGAGAGATYGSALGPHGILVGAALGAIVGAIGGILGEKSAQKDYKFGIPGIVGGQATFSNAKNMQPAEIQEAIAATQATFDTFRNGLVKVLMAFPDALMPPLQDIVGQFQSRASSHYLDNLKKWLTQTLPRELMDQVEGSLTDVFTGAGMTVEGVKKLLAEVKTMDPKQGLQYLTDLAQGIAAWNRAKQGFADASGVVYDDPMGGRLGLQAGRYQFRDGRVTSSGESDFSGQVASTAANLFATAREVVNLTGPDKVAAFHELGAGVEGLTRSLQDFLQSVGEAIRNVRATIADARLGKQLERAPDDEARKKILYGEFQNVQSQIQNAAAAGLSPAEVTQLTSRGVDLLNQIYALDPTAEIYAWWQRNLDGLEAISTNALQLIAQQATDQVGEVLKSLDPFRQYMLGLPVELGGPMSDFVASITGAKTALDELADAIRTGAGGGSGGGGGTGGTGGGGGDRSPDDSKAESVVIQLNAPVYGVDNLKAQMVAAVQSLIRKRPSDFESPFGV